LAKHATGYPVRDGRGAVRPTRGPCRDCKAPTVWATTGNGGRVLLDTKRLEGDFTAYVLLERPGGYRVALHVHVPDLADELAALLDLDVRTSHFDTCPVRQERRRPPERKDLE
jgi:hypothetical protein